MKTSMLYAPVLLALTLLVSPGCQKESSTPLSIDASPSGADAISEDGNAAGDDASGVDTSVSGDDTGDRGLDTSMAGDATATDVSPEVLKLAGRLKGHVETLAKMYGERNFDTPKDYRGARKYLEGKLDSMGYTTSLEKVDTRGETYHNVIAELEGASTPKEIVVVGAHYDAVRGSPGADDNATGVATVLELARTYANAKPSRTLRFILFCNEEPPFFGSETMGSYQHAAGAKKRGEQIVMMISMEMLGYYTNKSGSQEYPRGIEYLYPNREFPDKGNFVSFVTKGDGEKAVKKMDEIFEKKTEVRGEWLAAPKSAGGVSLSDHASFWKKGFPGVMITDTAYFRNPNYHKATDLPKTLDFKKFAQVVGGLEPVVDNWVNPN